MSDDITIFILGCGVMQLPALRIAREMGWRTAAADGNPEAPGRGLCDEFFPVDLKDVQGLIAAASSCSGGKGPNGVFTAGTDFSESTALAAHALGLPGHSPEAARRATDKVLMREAFRRAGIPSPDFAEAGPRDDAAAIGNRIPGPWVVKPVDSMGARGVLRVDDAAGLKRALAAAREYSRSGRALVETYMEGPEFSLDALMQNGRFIRCGLADRIITYPPRFIEIGHTIPSSADAETAEEIWRVFEEGARALGLTLGAAKGDVKLTPKGPMIGEIAARLSGGYMSGWTWPHASGVQPTRGGLRLAAGLDAGDCGAKRHLYCAERALIGIDGTVRRLSGAERALSLPGGKDVFLRFSPGEAVSFPRNNVEKLGNIIAVGSSAAEAHERALAGLRALNFELSPKDERTGTYLDSFDDFPPDCFDVQGFFDDLWKVHPPKPSRRHRTVCPRIAVPADLPDCRDSAGRCMLGIIRELQEKGYLRIAADGDIVGDAEGAAEGNAEASDLWRALVRGGAAGLRWFLE